jgi:hypothetical protein
MKKTLFTLLTTNILVSTPFAAGFSKSAIAEEEAVAEPTEEAVVVAPTEEALAEYLTEALEALTEALEARAEAEDPEEAETLLAQAQSTAELAATTLAELEALRAREEAVVVPEETEEVAVVVVVATEEETPSTAELAAAATAALATLAVVLALKLTGTVEF